MLYEGPSFNTPYGRRIFGKGSVRHIKHGKGKGRWRVRIRVPNGHKRMGLVYKTLYVRDFNIESEANHAYERVTKELFPSAMKLETEMRIQESRGLYGSARAEPNRVKKLILNCRALLGGTLTVSPAALQAVHLRMSRACGPLVLNAVKSDTVLV